MRKKILFGSLIVVASIVSSVLATDNEEYFVLQKITPSVARMALASEEEIVLIDVRAEKYYEEKRIPGSISIPLEELELKISFLVPDRSRRIFIYCQLGNSSKYASEILWYLGYRNVYDLGGIEDWPYETVLGNLRNYE